MSEGWCIFTGSAFRSTTEEEVNSAKWYNRIYFCGDALIAIEREQKLLIASVGENMGEGASWSGRVSEFPVVPKL